MSNVKTGNRRDKMVILELFKLEKDKTCIVLSLTNEIQGKKNVKAEGQMQRVWKWCF